MARHRAKVLTAGVFTRSWWSDTGTRVAATVLAALLPLVTQIATGAVQVDYALSVTAMAGLGSFLTALAVLPDEGSRPLWQAIVWRAVRTVGQVAGASLAGYVLVQEVPWQVVLVTVTGAVATTVLRTLLDRLNLPEVAAEPGGSV